MNRFFKQLWSFFKKAKKSATTLTQNIADGVNKYGHAIKEALNSNKLGALVALTSTDADNEILRALRSAFAELFPDAGIKGLANKKTLCLDDAEKFSIKIVEQIKTLSPILQDAVIHKIGSVALTNLDASILRTDADTLVQLNYAIKKFTEWQTIN